MKTTLGIITLMAALAALGALCPTWIGTIVMHMIAASFMVFLFGGLMFAKYKNYRQTRITDKQYSDGWELHAAKVRIEALIKSREASRWGQVQTWRQWVRQAESHPEDIEQALKWSTIIERELESAPSK